MTLFSSTEEKAVFGAYVRNDFWLRDVKRIYSPLGFWKRHFSEWDITISDLLSKLRQVSNARGFLPLLERQGETTSGFLDRLFTQLEFHGDVTNVERTNLKRALMEGSKLPYLKKPRARALTLKALLELARHRYNYLAFVHLSPHKLRTIDELLSLPYHITLPNGDGDFLTKVYDQWEMEGCPSDFLSEFSQGFIKLRFGKWIFSHDSLLKILEDRRRWLTKDTVEAHLAASMHYCDISYHAGVQKAASKYPSLSVAYSDLILKGTEDPKLADFLKAYPSYRKDIVLPTD